MSINIIFSFVWIKSARAMKWLILEENDECLQEALIRCFADLSPHCLLIITVTFKFKKSQNCRHNKTAKTILILDKNTVSVANCLCLLEARQ